MEEEVSEAQFPMTEIPMAQVPMAQVPMTEVPMAEISMTELSAEGAPSTEASTIEVPLTETSTIEVPPTEASTIEVPATEASTIEVPATEFSAADISTMEISAAGASDGAPSDAEIGGLHSPLPSGSSSHSSQSFYESPKCCVKFWGPFRAGGHTLCEAGGSVLLPQYIFLVWRILAFTYLFVSFIFITSNGISFKFLTIWSYTGLTFSFLLCVISSWRYWKQKSCYKNETRIFARWTVFFFQIFSSAALFVDVLFWTVIYDGKIETVTFTTVTTHVINLGIVLFDMFVGLSMQFRLWNCLATFIYFLIYYAFLWIYWAIHREWVYDVLDFNKHSSGKVAIYHGATIAGALVAPCILFLLNRINRLLRDDPRAEKYRERR